MDPATLIEYYVKTMPLTLTINTEETAFQNVRLDTMVVRFHKIALLVTTFALNDMGQKLQNAQHATSPTGTP